MIEKPDQEKIMKDLKDFQKKTVDYVFSRLYKDESKTDRFLIADEVGLGKTLEAKGVIGQTIDHLWNEQERIDIIYVCANTDIAQQNINRLNITGEREFSFATRITLLPLEIHNLKRNRLNFISFTPGTSFDLKSRGGRAKERILLYHILRDGGEFDSSSGPKNLFQVGVKKRKDWRNRLKNFDKEQIDEDLANAFLKKLDKRPNLKDRCRELIDCFSHYRKHENIPKEERRMRNEFIGELRQLLAKTCINELKPNLVILDEFQRFKYLLDGDDEISAIAHTLFDYKEAKVMLLSATPYKMYTMYHEHHEDNHYEDLIRTVKFLFDDENTTFEFKRELKDYRRELFNLDDNEIKTLRQTQKNIEQKLQQVMVRNERIDVSQDQNAMLREVEKESGPLTSRELESFNMVDRVADTLGVRNSVSYWKSAPYLLNFLDRNYKLKGKLKETVEDVEDPELSAEIKEIIAQSNGSLLEWQDIYNYQKIEPENAKLKSLIKRNIDNGAWKLLWIPPSSAYYEVKEGPYGEDCLQNFTKSLIFSSWRVVPRTVSTLSSYEAERRMIESYGKNKNYRDLWDERVQLLRFALKDDEPENMSNFTLMYPALTLCQKIDPLRLGRDLNGEELPQEKDVFDHAYDKINELMEPIFNEFRKDNWKNTQRDENWYWASLILLDRKYNPDSIRNWIENTDNGKSWSGMIESQKESENSVFKEHIDLLFRYFKGDVQLGPPPEDLIDVLAKIALASPAIVALRSYRKLNKNNRGEQLYSAQLLIEAARMAINFRSLFNLPDSSYLIRGLPFTEESRYWEGVLDYCLNGNLQAVLDEYVHMLRETNGLTNEPFDYVVERISAKIEQSLKIRSASLKFDEIETEPKLKLNSRNIRCRYAMQFSDNPNEAGKKTRRSQVREAFNSPFKPFILASTSIGQEGLDFHVYCHRIYHWNLPSNPVDLEQREGRIHRYKGHAIRKNVAHKYSLTSSAEYSSERDPWDEIFRQASQNRESGFNDMVPFWIFNYSNDGDKEVNINRHVPALPLSKDQKRFHYLKKTVGAYRMVFGQPRQEDLLEYLTEQIGEKLTEEDMLELKVDLSPD